MAHTTLINFPASSFIGDTYAQLVSGDAGVLQTNHVGRPVISFDATTKQAAVSHETSMPAQYANGTLTMDIFLTMASDTTNNVALAAFVEAKTPNIDTFNIVAASGWDTANSGTRSVSGSTAGDPLKLSIPLTNDDSVATGDLVRFGIRRDTTSVNDDAVGKLYLYNCEIWETT